MPEPAGRYTWDLDTPHPNVDIETLRVATRQAIADLTAAVEQLQQAQAGVADAYWLTDLLFTLVGSAVAAGDAAAADRQQLADTVDAHRIRLEAVEISAQTAQDGVDLLQTQMADVLDRLTALEAATTIPGGQP